MKGGSLGQGTAIPGNFDLDLVLYSSGEKNTKTPHDSLLYNTTKMILFSDVDAARVARYGVRDILNKLERFLRRHFGANCQNLDTTDFGLSFKFHGEIEVDLLPSPFWASKEDFHAFLSGCNNSERRK